MGNKYNPILDLRKPESAFETLQNVSEVYYLWNKLFRKLYKWSPLVIDEILVSRLIQIFKETKEDLENNPKEEMTEPYLEDIIDG